MSLKAKFEAVIYAAEEPVTLAQLASLFASELAPEQPWQQDEPAPATDANSPAPDAVEVADAADATSPTEAAETMPPSPPLVGEAAVKAAAESEAAAKEAAKAHTAAVRAENRKLRDAARVIVDELVADYASAERGIEMREVAGGYRLSTRPEYHDAVRMFVKSLKPALKLSLPALETLAVIAYRQPIGRAEIESVRGVAVDGVVATLLERKVIRIAGRSEQPGRPLLYETTPLFLELFGLKGLDELPNADELRRLQPPETPHAPQQQELEVELVTADAAPAPAGGPDRPEDAAPAPAAE
jgi:segregation and condensation protein B